MSSTSAPRRILVDDTDPSVEYGSSGWFVSDSTKLNTQGNFGPLWNNTSHSTTTSGSTLSFTFSGTSVAVYGTIDINTTNNVTTPTWTCLVDDIAIDNPSPTFQFPENNWLLCDQATLTAGALHKLTINVQTTGQAFNLDYILYTPTSDVDLGGKVLEYTNTDASVSFGSGWQVWGAQNVTQTQGAQVALNFHGTAVTLLGYVPTELPHNASTASFSVDGGAATTFNLAGLSGSTTEYNVPVVIVEDLPAATHNLVVTYDGDKNHTPLPVGAFYVTNAATTTTSSSGTGGASGRATGTGTGTAPGTSSSSDLSTTGETTTKKSNTGAIVGGTIGCLAILALLAGVLFCLRRRRRQHAGSNPLDPSAPRPFMAQTDAGASSSMPSGQAVYHYAPPSQALPIAAMHATAQDPFASPVGTPGSTHSPYGSLSPASGSVSTHALAQQQQQQQMPLQPQRAAPQLEEPSMLAYASSAYPYQPPMTPSAPSQPSLSGHGSGASARGGHAPSASVSSAGRTTSTDRTTTSAGVAGLGAGPLPSKLDMLAPQRRPVVIQQSTDSGVRIRAPSHSSSPSLLSEPEVVELPPGYSRD